MFAPNPVKPLLGHPQSDDDIDVIAIVLLASVFQRRRHAIAFARIIIDQVCNPQGAPVRCPDQLEPGRIICAQPIAELLDDVLHLADFVLSLEFLPHMLLLQILSTVLDVFLDLVGKLAALGSGGPGVAPSSSGSDLP